MGRIAARRALPRGGGLHQARGGGRRRPRALRRWDVPVDVLRGRVPGQARGVFVHRGDGPGQGTALLRVPQPGVFETAGRLCRGGVLDG